MLLQTKAKPIIELIIKILLRFFLIVRGRRRRLESERNKINFKLKIVCTLYRPDNQRMERIMCGPFQQH